MIQLNTQYPVTQHPRMALLQQKYRQLCLSMSRQAAPLPVTVTFVPSSGSGIAFDRPIARVGSALLCGLEPTDDDSDRLTRSQYTYRGLRARYVPDAGKVVWEDQDWFAFPLSSKTYASQFDERLIRSPKYLDVLIGLHQLASRMAGQTGDRGYKPTMPPTLLGFVPQGGERLDASFDNDDPLADQLSSHPTEFIQKCAAACDLTVSQAWRVFDAETHMPGDVEMFGLRLVDARLVSPESLKNPLVKVTGAYHDLRAILGRSFTNPSRKLPELEVRNPAEKIVGEINRQRGDVRDPGEWTQAEADQAMALMRERIGPLHVFFDDHDISEALVTPGKPARVQDFDAHAVLHAHGTSAAARGLRRLMMKQVSDGCSDENLVNALNNPDAPLIASLIARRQCWSSD